MDPNDNDTPEDHNNIDGTWQSGNQAVTAALLIGNRCTGNNMAYYCPTTVPLENCRFSVTSTTTRRNSQETITAGEVLSVYIWSRTEGRERNNIQL